MNINSFLTALRGDVKPKFFILYCEDSSLRQVYIDLWVKAHGGKLVYKETPDIGRQPRLIGPKPVYVVLDYEPAIKKPSHKFITNGFPMLLMYTKPKLTPSAEVQKVYEGKLAVIEPVTGEQASNMLTRVGVPEVFIQYLKDKTSSMQEAILLGKQLVSLAGELNLPLQKCFDTYYKPWLAGRNIDEEPTAFLHAILEKSFTFVFGYLNSQRGNELFVYASLLNWLEDVIKFCSCNGDYWHDAGLVAARYRPLKSANVGKVPFSVYVRLHSEGLRSMQSIKINEPDAFTALEVFVCRIIQTLG